MPTPRKPRSQCPQCGAEVPRPKSKYCSPQCLSAHRTAQTSMHIENDSLANVSQGSLRKYLLANRPHQCAKCSRKTWNGHPIPLVMDHIDGDATNNQLANMRLVCPNCDSQLPTFKGRNKGRGRAARRERYAKGQSY